jgi:hypothetical protein
LKRSDIHDRGSLHQRLTSLSEASAEKWDTTAVESDTVSGDCPLGKIFQSPRFFGHRSISDFSVASSS